MGTHAARKQINVLFGDSHVGPNMLWVDFCSNTIPQQWDPLAP